MEDSETTPLPAPEKVLDAFVTAGPGRDTLAEFVERYPEYRDDLIDFAAHWGVQEHLPEENVATTEVNELNRRGREAAMQHFGGTSAQEQERKVESADLASKNGFEAVEGSKSSKGTPTLERDMPVSFEALLEKAGLDLDSFSEVSGLGFSTLANLGTSRLTFATGEERRRVAETLAGDIEKAAEQEALGDVQLAATVEQTLTQPPRRTAGAHRAEQAPEATTQNFFVAVRADRQMTEEAKRRWLHLEE